MLKQGEERGDTPLALSPSHPWIEELKEMSGASADQVSEPLSSVRVREGSQNMGGVLKELGEIGHRQRRFKIPRVQSKVGCRTKDAGDPCFKGMIEGFSLHRISLPFFCQDS